MDELNDARYISLTTYKTDGSAKSTPVWFAGSDGAYLVYTGAQAWKTKRLRRNPAVQVRVCDLRGRVDPDAAVYNGTAEVLDDPSDVDRALRAIGEKYGWQVALVRVRQRINARLGRPDSFVGIRIRLA